MNWNREQAEGAHPEDLPLIAGGQGRDHLDLARDMQAILVTLLCVGVCALVLAGVTYLF